MRPATSILNPAFKYRNSACTDIRDTFRKVRERMEAEQRLRNVVAKVKPIRRIECKSSASQ
jgi:hypothetical protein